MTHSENYVIFLETHPPPKKNLNAILPFSYVRSEFFCFRISEMNLEFLYAYISFFRSHLSIFLFSLIFIFQLSLLFAIALMAISHKKIFLHEVHCFLKTWDEKWYFVIKIFLTSIEQFIQSAKGQDTFWNRMLVSRGFSDLFNNTYIRIQNEKNN